MSRQKKPDEAVRGRYAALPHAVLDSPAYTGASIAAKALLNEVARQHNGTNNGRLHLSHKWLAPRGWQSKSTVEKARTELIERGLIVQTKQGGLFVGASWHALTWLPILNHVGLETSPSTYHPGGWQFCDLPPTARRKPPMKKISQPVHRGSTDPTTGAVDSPTDPTAGAIKPVFGTSPDPYTGDDVCIPLPPTENLSAIQQFKARIGGKLSTPERAPNPLGRTRHIRLFKAAFGHLTAPSNEPTPARQFEAVERFIADTGHLSPPGQNKPRHGRYEAIQRFLKPTMREAGWRIVGAVPVNHPKPTVSIFH